MSLPISDSSTEQKIIAAARRHFLEHGFRSVTMDDLASEMGMSKKTLYVHFKSKRELLLAVMETKLGQFRIEMGEILGAESGFAGTLRGLLACSQKHTREISPTFVRDLVKEAPDLIEVMKERRREVIAHTYGRLLQIGQREGAVRSDISVEAMIAILLGVSDAVATPEKIAERGVSPSEVIDEILAIFLNGVLTEKGRVQV